MREQHTPHTFHSPLRPFAGHASAVGLSLLVATFLSACGWSPSGLLQGESGGGGQAQNHTRPAVRNCGIYVVQATGYGGANVRRSPNGAILGVAPNGSRFTLVRAPAAGGTTPAGWLYGRTEEGLEGYVFAELLRPIPCQDPTQPVPPPPPPPPPGGHMEHYKVASCYDGLTQVGGQEVFSLNVVVDGNGRAVALVAPGSAVAPAVDAHVVQVSKLETHNPRAFKVSVEGHVGVPGITGPGVPPPPPPPPHSTASNLQAVEFVPSAESGAFSTLRLRMAGNVVREYSRCVLSNTQLLYSRAGSWTVASCRDNQGQENLKLNLWTDALGRPVRLEGRRGQNLGEAIDFSVVEFNNQSWPPGSRYLFVTRANGTGHVQAESVEFLRRSQPHHVTYDAVAFNAWGVRDVYEQCSISNLGLMDSLAR